MKKLFFILFSLVSVSAFGQTYGNHNAARFTTLDGIIVANGTSNATAITDGSTGEVLTTDGAGGYTFETIPTQVTFGTDNQIPFTNSGGTGFDYDADFTWNGSIFSVTGEATVDNVNLNGSTISATGATDLSLFLSSAGTGSVFINSTAYFTNGGQLRIRNTTNQISLGAEDPAFRTILNAVAPSATRTYTIPDFGSNDTFVGLAATQALTNKTYNGLTISGSAGTLTIPTSSSLIRAGAHSLTLTTTGTTDVTFPTSGTLATESFVTTSYTPMTRTITINGTANEITSSSGAQDLSSNRTWTLSLPSALTFTGKTVTGGTFNATAFNGPIGNTTPSTVAATTGNFSSAVTMSGTSQSNGTIQFTGTNGGGNEGITYNDTGGVGRYALFFPGADVVTIANRAANGTVQIRANNATAGSGGESTIATFSTTGLDLGSKTLTTTGSITGGAASFTTGAFSGNVAFDTNTMFVDAASNRVGIGTSSPSVGFEIEGTGFVTSQIQSTDGTATVRITSEEASMSRIQFGDSDVDAGAIYYNNADNSMTFYTNVTTEAMRINSAQNIGIGTSDLDGTPAIGRLTVKGSTADGSTNIIVGRDSGEANVFSVDTDGDIYTASGTLTDGTYTNTLPISSGTLLNTTDFTAANGFGYQKVTVTVPSASVLALNTSPYELIPAPGAGKFIIVDRMIVSLDYNSAPYDNVVLRVVYNTTDNMGLTHSNILNATADVFGTNFGGGTNIGFNFINSKVSLYTATNPVGGNSDIKITLFYWIGEI